MKSNISVLVFLAITSVIFPQRDLNIISSDFNSITIEYLPFYSDTSVITIDNITYRKIDLMNGYTVNENEIGLPVKLARLINVGVPSEYGNTIEILSSAYKILDGNLLPVPEVVPDTISFSFKYSRGTEYNLTRSSDELVEFGEFGLIRDVGTQVVNILPVKFDQVNGKIKLYTRIVFRINFVNSGLLSSKPASDLLDGVLVNYDVAKYWNISSQNKNSNSLAAANSVLANGKWVRFEAPEEGIYKITKSNLSLYGIDANTVDPRTIKIYNNSGKVLPELITTARPVDLVENAIYISGESDGKFDDNDYILFYGRGSSFWDFDTDGKTIKRFFNYFSNKNYFWITSGGEAGKRMNDKPGLNTTPDAVQTTTSAYADWEVDKINLGKSGKQFVGDNFTQSVTSRTYVNKLDGRAGSTLINYNFRFVVGSPTGLTLKVTENGTQIFQENLSGYGTSPYRAGNQHLRSFSYSGTLTDNRSTLNFSIVPAAATSTGYIDYFELNYIKELKSVDDNLLFFSNPVTGVIEYELSNFSNSNIKVYDVTDYANVKVVSNYSFLSGGECKFQMSENLNQRSKYIAVGNDKFKTPSNQTEIQNSNLRGEQNGAKFIIVTHKNFKDAANRLKTYRETQATVPISTIVVDIEQVYNEFGGGINDPTALRDFLKYAYDNWNIKPDYVLLFGKGTYDYKNVEGYGDNFIPTWQTLESLGLVDSYTTDDFFVRVSGPDSMVDIALGRITCANATDANNIVTKIIFYEQSSNKGIWQNLITLVSDDGLKSDGTYEGTEHTAPSESLATYYLPSSFDINKIYSAAYPDVITGQGRRKPEVNQAIIDAINNGTLFLNYIGHGSPELWAHEVIFEKSVVLPQLKNDKYFFLCAATCDFSYFDIPNYQSAGEALIMLPNIGAIAGFSASRLVYSQANHQLNFELVKQMFKSNRDTLNLTVPIGKASFKAKQQYFGVNDQKYNILGDPTLRLLVPQYFSSIDSVNSQSTAANIQVKALSKTKIEGTILKPDNTIWTDFNGEGLLTFFDSERITRLVFQGSNNPAVLNVKEQGGVIFKGRVSINSGRFSTEFVVPKDISYENKNGKMIFYFYNNTSDGIGYTDKVIVGGTDSSVVNDGKGPDIEIFFDDIAYNNGYLVNSTPKLIVKLSDETGINTTGTGVGHKLEGILNQQLSNPIDFTNYFTGDLDAGGKSGSINYKFSNLDNGDYQLLVKAWDVFNNFSEENSFFTVVNGNDIVIRDVYNYPNPFTDKTQFTFQHNLSKPVDVKIKIYTIAGRLIKVLEEFNINEKFVVVNWDGRDADGDKLANGTYLYKVIVNTVDGEYSKSVLGKLAVIK